MKMNLLKRRISALGLALFILGACLIATPNVAVTSTEMLTADGYHLNDDNKPERS